MPPEKAIQFYSDGLRLSGVLFVPEAPAPHPGIVLCHGFTAIKELILPDYARRYAAAGYAALTFDYRGFGESEGPRGRLIPLEQVNDIRNAITFLQAQPEIDPARIGLWGTSFGGAHVPYVAGIDGRARAAVAQVGFGDGERLFRRKADEAGIAMMQAMLEGDRRQRVLTGQGAMVDPFQMLSDEDSVRFFSAAIKDQPNLKTLVSLETAEKTWATKAAARKGCRLGMISPKMMPRSPTPESLATETNCRSFIVSTCARTTSVGAIQASSTTTSAIV